MSVADARSFGRTAIEANQTAQLDADLLLSHVLGRRREQLLMDSYAVISDVDWARYEGLLRRRAEGEPVAYLTGLKSWFGLDLVVSPDVLIPRPETELLVEHAIGIARVMKARTAVDVGTGSGALAVALAVNVPDVNIIATDESQAALEIARQNINAYSVEDRVTLDVGDLLEPIQSEPDLIMANLPYIPESDRATLAPEVLREPAKALFAGVDGMECIRRLLRQTADRRWESTVLLEIDPRQAEPLAGFIGRELPDRAMTLLLDLSGRYRVIVLRMKDEARDKPTIVDGKPAF